MGKVRDYRFDAAKGIAMFCIIIGHLGLNEIGNFVFIFHVPIFFLISGYFFKNDNAAVKNYMKRLIPAYVLTVFGVIVMDTLFGLVNLVINSDCSIKDIAKNICKWLVAGAFGSGARGDFLGFDFPSIGAIWFLLALMWAVIMLRGILYFVPKNEFIRLAVVLIIFMSGIWSSEYIWLPLSIQSGTMALLFVYIGYEAKLYSKKVGSEKILVILSALFFGISVYLAYSGHGVLIMVRDKLSNGIFDILGALGASYIIIKASRFLKPEMKIGKAVTYLGENSLMALCFHLIELNTFPWKIISETVNNSVLSYGVIIVLKLVWVYSMIYLVHKIKSHNC